MRRASNKQNAAYVGRTPWSARVPLDPLFAPDCRPGVRPTAALAWLFAAGLLSAQYPGQYPPGQYPPGQTPGGQAPMPRLPFPKRGKKGPGDKKPTEKEVFQQFTGKIEKLEKDSFTIQAPDTRAVTFKCTKITKYLQDEKEIQRSVLKVGDEVDIDARSDDEGYFYAVNVKLEKPAEPPAKPAAEKRQRRRRKRSRRPPWSRPPRPKIRTCPNCAAASPPRAPPPRKSPNPSPLPPSPPRRP